MGLICEIHSISVPGTQHIKGLSYDPGPLIGSCLPHKNEVVSCIISPVTQVFTCAMGVTCGAPSGN